MKKVFLKKRARNNLSRTVWIKSSSEIRSVLLVCNNEDKSAKKILEEEFPKAKVHLLHLRETKEDRSIGFYHSVHSSDFNLTGNLKNDKLKNLEKFSYDLLVDLSKNSELLNYFVNKSDASFKVGEFGSKKSNSYDLMVNFASKSSDSVLNVIKQLNLLTGNETI